MCGRMTSLRFASRGGRVGLRSHAGASPVSQSLFAFDGRQRGNILATNAGDKTSYVALHALRIVANTGRNGVDCAVPGEPIPLSRRQRETSSAKPSNWHLRFV